MAAETGTFAVKKGLAQMLKGGVIMDVVTPEHARIAEDAGAVAVMALERVPADIRAQGGVARGPGRREMVARGFPMVPDRAGERQIHMGALRPRDGRSVSVRRAAVRASRLHGRVVVHRCAAHGRAARGFRELRFPDRFAL